MKTQDSTPQEVGCFVCLKQLKDYKKVVLNIHCRDSIVSAIVPVCQDDFEYIKKNPDASTALLQSRLQAILKQNEEDNNN